MTKRLELTGCVFGRLTVIEYAGNSRAGQSLWRCRCDCGKETVVLGRNLKGGVTSSCGCLLREQSSARITARNLTHGQTGTRLYKVRGEMRRRCENEHAQNYPLYGGRGVKVCERWLKFEAFFEDMREGYARGLTLDRIDVNGGYCKENCRWVTAEEQAQNRRNTILIAGVSLRKYCRDNGISYDMAYQRTRRGWTAEDAVSLPRMPGKRIKK